MDKQLLMKLVHNPSPSGAEWEGQKIWCNAMKPYADAIQIDEIGNAVAIYNPQSPFKVLLAGHCDEIAFMVRRIDQRGFIYVEKVGGINPKVAIGMTATILSKNPVSGVFGVNAEHHGGVKEKLSIEDIFLDIGAQNKEEAERYASIGDFIVYDCPTRLLLNNRISGRGLDNRTGQFIVGEILKKVSQRGATVGVYAASTVNEETNMGGAHFVAARYEPTIAIAFDVTFATDYPGTNVTKHGEVYLDKGPVLAKGAPIHPIVNSLIEESAKRCNISLQYELNPRSTGTDADRMRVAGKGIPTVVVSLPLRYMHSPVEVASLQDMQQIIDMLTEFICSLSGNESLLPYSLD